MFWVKLTVSFIVAGLKDEVSNIAPSNLINISHYNNNTDYSPIMHFMNSFIFSYPL